MYRTYTFFTSDDQNPWGVGNLPNISALSTLIFKHKNAQISSYTSYQNWNKWLRELYSCFVFKAQFLKVFHNFKCQSDLTGEGNRVTKSHDFSKCLC